MERKGIIQDWHNPTYNSSVMVWDAGEHSEVWARLTPAEAKSCPGDQDWLTKVGGWDLLPPEWCVSYRTHAQVWPPYEAKVVCYHGEPKPHEITTGWTRICGVLAG